MMPLINIIIPSYLLFSGVGFIIVFILFYIRTRKQNIKLFHIVQLGIFCIVGIAVGSRFLFLLTRLPDIFNGNATFIGTIINGGYVFYGGLGGAFLGIYVYSKIRKWNYKNIINIIIPCFPLFHLFGRIGCFMSGCCYRIECSVGIPLAVDPTIKRFPVQLVESGCCIIIFLILIFISKRKNNENLYKIYLSMYACIRFILEFLRGDIVRGIWFGLSTSQWISIGLIVWIVSIGVNKFASPKSFIHFNKKEI